MSDFSLLIGGKLVAGDSTMDVINPATEEVLARCPRASAAQLNLAVAAAKRAFPAWAATPIEERRNVLRAIADVIDANADELARLLTQEQGKPLKSSRGEVTGAAKNFRHFASYDLPVEILEDGPERRIEAHRNPLGVVAAIVPWNYPITLMSWKVPPALLAGNTVIVKPAPTTPLSTLRIGELIKDVVPAGVINIVTDLNDLGPLIGAHPDISKISFTGSTATGRRVMASAADTLKHLTLELGGNDAAIVMADADYKTAARHLYDQSFGNSGQICIAIKRLYVHESIYDEVCDELVALADQAVIGDGMQQGTTMGPLNNKAQYEKVKGLIAEAHTQGKVIAGGKLPEGKGYFIPPTIVRDIGEGTRLVDEEQFGPVLPVMSYASEDEVIGRVNATPWGLGGSIWTSNPARALELAQQIDAGTVWINEHGALDTDIPFGGSKQSGLGSEFGLSGLHQYTQTKIVRLARGEAPS
jgi:acyl-CoA reductase-like NAD-dependent aldehyde dehydrogenase